MTDAVLVISRPQLRTCHSIVMGFLRAAGHTIRRVRVRLSDASGVAVEEKMWFNDSADATAIAKEVAHHITSSASLIWKLSSPSRMANNAIAPRASELADDDGPIFSTVAKLVEALKRSIPEGTQNAELKNEALRPASELLRGTKYEEQL